MCSKKGMLLISILVLISGVLHIISKPINSFETLIVARFLSGVLSGLFSGICPMYLSEISPINLRGSIVILNQLVLTLGTFTASVFGLPDLLGTRELWPYLVGLMMVPSLFHLGLFLLLKVQNIYFITKMTQ